jgi:SAM-dependent methyltransferase
MRSLLVAETAPGHWLPWGDLEHSVRTGTPATLKTFGKATWDYYAEHADEGEEFSRGMSAISEMVTQAFLASYPIGDAALVVDVGGAHGALLAAVLQAAPRARGVLIDRPNVVAAARPTLERMGVVDRVTCVGGDFFEAVPSGADVYLLKAILHDWNDDECVRILSTVRRAMPAHGRIVVVEMLIDAEGPPSPAAPLMDLNMLVMLTGRERTQAEFADVFRRAGLDLSRVVPTPSPFVALEARRA